MKSSALSRMIGLISISVGLFSWPSLALTSPSSSSCSDLFGKLASDESSYIAGKFRRLGFENLQHRTRIDKLASIFRSDGLVTGEKVPVASTGPGLGANRKGMVFVIPSKFTEPSADYSGNYRMTVGSFDPVTGFVGPFADAGKTVSKLDGAVLVFDLAPLGKLRFHMADSWHLGEFRKKTDVLSTDSRSQIDEFFQRNGYAHEIVFYEDLSLRFLKEIWVHPLRREEVISLLQAAGVRGLNGIPIADLIKSPNPSGVEMVELANGWWGIP